MVYKGIFCEKLICRGKPLIPFVKKSFYLRSDGIVFFKSILRAVGQFHTKYATYNHINLNSHQHYLSEISCPLLLALLGETNVCVDCCHIFTCGYRKYQRTGECYIIGGQLRNGGLGTMHSNSRRVQHHINKTEAVCTLLTRILNVPLVPGVHRSRDTLLLSEHSSHVECIYDEFYITRQPS